LPGVGPAPAGGENGNDLRDRRKTCPVLIHRLLKIVCTLVGLFVGKSSVQQTASGLDLREGLTGIEVNPAGKTSLKTGRLSRPGTGESHLNTIETQLEIAFMSCPIAKINLEGQP